MGQNRTPACLLDGKAYALGKKLKGKTHSWEEIEQSTRAAKQQLTEKLAADLAAGNADETARLLDRWSARQADKLVDVLTGLGATGE
jgi:succinate dehydrogenase/fumarate reductase flavoprotein subunit